MQVVNRNYFDSDTELKEDQYETMRLFSSFQQKKAQLSDSVKRETSDLSAVRLLIMMLMFLEIRTGDFNSKMAICNRSTAEPHPTHRHDSWADALKMNILSD